MSTFYATKVDGVLIAADDDSAEKMASLGLDTIVKCTATKQRNGANHRRYFAFLKVAYDMQNKYDSIKIFRKVMQMGAGYFTTAVSPKGVTLFIPDSIAFEEIGEEEFKLLFKNTLNYYLKELVNSRVVSDDEFLRLLDFD